MSDYDYDYTSSESGPSRHRSSSIAVGGGCGVGLYSLTIACCLSFLAYNTFWREADSETGRITVRDTDSGREIIFPRSSKVPRENFNYLFLDPDGYDISDPGIYYFELRKDGWGRWLVDEFEKLNEPQPGISSPNTEQPSAKKTQAR